MSITIKSQESETKELPVTQFDPVVYEAILQAIQKDATYVVTNALNQGAELSRAMVENVKKELYEIKANTKQVMVVQIDDKPVVKLAHEAVPFLGRMIVNAKIGTAS